MNERKIPGYLFAATVFLAAQLSVIQLGEAQEAAPAAAPSTPIVLKAARLFDSVSGKIVDHGMVVVVDKKIQAVGASAPIPADARIIDLGDATLLPGFIDAHVHLASESSSHCTARTMRRSLSWRASPRCAI